MSRYETTTWKQLEEVQNELETYVQVDILTITGFMKDEQLPSYLEECKQKLKRYKEV